MCLHRCKLFSWEWTFLLFLFYFHQWDNKQITKWQTHRGTRYTVNRVQPCICNSLVHLAWERAGRPSEDFQCQLSNDTNGTRDMFKILCIFVTSVQICCYFSHIQDYKFRNQEWKWEWLTHTDAYRPTSESFASYPWT